MSTEAKRRANAKYQAAHSAALSLRLGKDEAAAFKAACQAANTTPSAVFREAMHQFMGLSGGAGGPAEAPEATRGPEGQGEAPGPEPDV